MSSRSQRTASIRRLVVWGVLVAFCVCLFTPELSARSRPYDVKDTKTVHQETDDGGWAGGVSIRSKPIDKRHSLFATLTRWLRGVALWQYPFVIPKPPIGNENDGQETAHSGASQTTAAE